MKRWLSVCLIFAILVGMLSVCGSLAFAEGAAFRDGDVDGDGAVSTTDVRVLLQLIVKMSDMPADQWHAADSNNDGTVNTTDAKQMLERVTGNKVSASTISLLPTDVDDWHNPVQTDSDTPAIVSETKLADGSVVFENVGGAWTWPYAAYVYDAKILLPETAVIEYDLTVGAAATSINLYTGGSLPDLNGDEFQDAAVGRTCVKLNSLISSTNLDVGSGDLLTGSYSGSIPVSSLAVGDDCRVDGMVWLSGIKIYAVGADGATVTVRKLQVSAYQDPVDHDVPVDPYRSVRYTMYNSEEVAGMDTLTGMEVYEDGSRLTGFYADLTADIKKIYHNITSKRVMNYPDGYKIDLPFDWEAEYSLAALRSRYISEHYSLTVTKEDQNPYGNTSQGWNTYLTEWLNRFIADSSFLSANGMSYMRTPVESTTMLDGYTVLTYDIKFNNTADLDFPYYSIAVIRKTTVYDEFYLMVLKSDARTTSVIDRLIRSFEEITAVGTAVNTQGQYEQIVPEYWSDETKAYYEKLCTQDTTDFGFFSASMVDRSDSSFSAQTTRIESEYERLSTALDYDYAIMPTYTHLRYGSKVNNFPSDMAQTYAGGNGFNGKPVLQFTYQFTTQNNTNLEGYTPMFDILRGNFDTTFRELAQDIKAYGKPVLFRLNNEMNTDWTSYAGILTLLDPDIFVQTWQRMYDIFVEEGVDNCIWIFNPISTTTPYCAWGEALCYMPGEEYVQILGLTNYEMGNGTSVSSFKKMYTETYDKNKDHFIQYPWVISEFGCGAGGEKCYDWSQNGWVDTELGRNGDLQAEWVAGMFECLNNKSAEENAFCRQIKGAVWFSTNDSIVIDGTEYITNYLKLDSNLNATLDAFKNGLNITA